MKGTIYKISFLNTELGKVYYGSTTQTLNTRKLEHKSRCYNERCDAYNKNLYKYIRENTNWDNVKFDVIEQFDDITKHDLEKKEMQYIKENRDNVLNTRICNIN